MKIEKRKFVIEVLGVSSQCVVEAEAGADAEGAANHSNRLPQLLRAKKK
jgi:hypothetical protein